MHVASAGVIDDLAFGGRRCGRTHGGGKEQQARNHGPLARILAHVGHHSSVKPEHSG
jgi:hypothetical protein